MSKIGYTITQAADAAGVTVRMIEVAVRAKQLKAHRVEGQAVMLKDDITTWLRGFPSWD
ncbi:helix-turn-helix domain-containing protein [Cryobacterium melibiosiphilum]|uniref:helix-turn-helix domain-containing protein n=1 Tax=Cryobacterium melibiosiphilum TaxID=995039 RepID=UPI0011C22D4A|nr:helix-turn-helix domain-containing protein [Cryobacterium melibiosiphilum]